MAPGDRVVRVSSANRSVLDAIAADVFDDDLVARFLETTGHLPVVAIRGGLVVGQAQGYVQHHLDSEPQLYVDILGVSPSFRRQHLATALLDAIVEWGRELRCEQAWIVTEPDNDAANALYRSIGADHSPAALYAVPIATALSS